MLQINHLYKSYHAGGVSLEALKDINLSVEKGEFVAVMGPSGSGKTTLLSCICCFLTPDSGEILLNNTPLNTLDGIRLAEILSRRLAFVFRDSLLFNGLTVYENICIPRLILRSHQKPMEVKAQKLMKLFNISDLAGKYPPELSGGQKQLTAIARALMNRPELILADEPAGNLDSRSKAAVIGAFLKAKEELDATIFMTTHDYFTASYCDRVILLMDGRVQKELKRCGSRHEFLDLLLNELPQSFEWPAGIYSD